MKKIKYISALLLLAAMIFGTAACDKNNEQEPPNPDPGIIAPLPNEDTVLTRDEAQALVDEKLIGDLEGYTSTLTEEQTGHYIFTVFEPEGGQMAQIAVDKESGTRYEYKADGTLEPYEQSALFVASTDMVCDWNGIFKGEDFSVELMQEDASSFYFAFSDGLSGNARVQGNTAISDGTPNLVFVISPEQNLLYVCGNSVIYEGTYNFT